MFSFICLRLYVYIYLLTFICLRLYVYVYMFTCICLRVYVYVYMFTFIFLQQTGNIKKFKGMCFSTITTRSDVVEWCSGLGSHSLSHCCGLDLHQKLQLFP